MKQTTQERKRLEKLYNYLYHKVDAAFAWDKCIYCNADMQVWDHCPPISMCDSLDIEEYKSNGNTFTLYPCCTKCNNSLNNYREIDIYLRLNHLIATYTKKLRNRKLWENSEIDSLGYTLKSLIKTNQAKYKEINNKIVALTSNYLSNDYNSLVNTIGIKPIINKPIIKSNIDNTKNTTIKDFTEESIEGFRNLNINSFSYKSRVNTNKSKSKPKLDVKLKLSTASKYKTDSIIINSTVGNTDNTKYSSFDYRYRVK